MSKKDELIKQLSGFIKYDATELRYEAEKIEAITKIKYESDTSETLYRRYTYLKSCLKSLNSMKDSLAGYLHRLETICLFNMLEESDKDE